MLGECVAGRYLIGRLLGEGGMGEVYEARDRRTGARVALKLMVKRRTKDPDLVARFERETAILRSLRSPHLAQVFDAGVDRDTDRPYLVMELL
jgi:eukaryotic-like serine/threonine-protein kinase